MANSGTVIKVIKNDFPKIAAGMEDKTRDAIRETQLFIVGKAASAAPIRTGALANANQMGDIESYEGNGLAGEVYNTMEYASYVNYGTGARGAQSAVPDRGEDITYTGSWLGMTARPFMSQAAADARPMFLAAMEKIVG